MRKDAADALAYGCTGLMGIHWRTRILGPNVSALAAAAWDQTGWNPAIDARRSSRRRKPPEGPDGGQFAGFPDARSPTPRTTPLYQTVRYNIGGYCLDVPNGNYTVTLKFCEPHYDQSGKRVFGVKLQGKPVDRAARHLRARSGKNQALDYTFNDVEVTDGRLAIEFGYEVEFPCIAAIVVEGPVTRKINCGGPAYKDYPADWPPSSTRRAAALPAGRRFLRRLGHGQFGPEAADAARGDLHAHRRPPAAALGLGRRARRHQARPAALGRGRQGVCLRR